MKNLDMSPLSVHIIPTLAMFLISGLNLGLSVKLYICMSALFNDS